MSTFIQHNKGKNSKGVQVFSSDQKEMFHQYGGGTQIIDGEVVHTQNVESGQVAFQSPSPNTKGGAVFIQNINGENCVGIQAMHINQSYRK